MREQNGVSVLVASATLLASDISARVGLTPDASWLAGATYGAFGATRKHHGLQLETKLGPTVPLDEHIKDMIRRLAPSAQKLGQLGKEIEVTFTCSIQSRRAPVLHFDRDTLRWLAVMNARLDIDTAVVSDPPKPASGGAAGAPGAKPA